MLVASLVETQQKVDGFHAHAHEREKRVTWRDIAIALCTIITFLLGGYVWWHSRWVTMVSSDIKDIQREVTALDKRVDVNQEKNNTLRYDFEVLQKSFSRK